VPIGRAIANTRLYVLDCLRPGDLYPARGRRRTEIALRRAQWSGDADLLEYRQVGVKNDCSASTNVRSAVNRYRNRLTALRRLYITPDSDQTESPAWRNSRSRTKRDFGDDEERCRNSFLLNPLAEAGEHLNLSYALLARERKQEAQRMPFRESPFSVADDCSSSSV
jgi:hypothetical protein